MTDDILPRLIIPAAQRDALRALAEAAYPEEFCALLIGRDETADCCRVTRIVSAANVHPEPRTGFEVDPRVLIATLRDLREAEGAGQGNRERLLGNAHSHPDGPARPSTRDLASAFESRQFWVVMAIRSGCWSATAGFQAVTSDDGQMAFRPAVIEEDGEG
jgi:proteasome lid subunit RPN8/RPN11